MFEKIKSASEKETLTNLLTFIVEGTQGPTGRVLAPATLVAKIEKAEPTFVKTQGEADVAGNITTFATSLGIAAVTGKNPAEVAATVAKPSFALETGFVPPAPSKRGGVKTDIYPFAQMTVGQSFFIPATNERPNPAKAMGSTVSSANRRYLAVFPATTGKDKKPHPQAGQPTGQDGRKFTVRPRIAGVDGEKANGARVYRIA